MYLAYVERPTPDSWAYPGMMNWSVLPNSSHYGTSQDRVADGMLRCYFVNNEVVGFARQYPEGLSPAELDAGTAEVPNPDRILGLPAAKTMYGPDEPAFQAIRRNLESEWVPRAGCGSRRPMSTAPWRRPTIPRSGTAGTPNAARGVASGHATGDWGTVWSASAPGATYTR